MSWGTKHETPSQLSSGQMRRDEQKLNSNGPPTSHAAIGPIVVRAQARPRRKSKPRRIRAVDRRTRTRRKMAMQNAPPRNSPSCPVAHPSARRRQRRVPSRRSPAASSAAGKSVIPAAPRVAAASHLAAAPVMAAAPRRFSMRLASARDRERLRERNRRERERVEKMLEATPFSIEELGAIPDDRLTEFSIDRAGVRELRSIQPRNQPHERAMCGCPICGESRIVSDEVVQLGMLRLSQCLRCEHRWTARGPDRWAEVGAPMKRARPGASVRTSEGLSAGMRRQA